MAGQPQQREAGLLYGGDPVRLLAMIRLEQQMDGSGKWLIYLNNPAADPRQEAEFDDEDTARAELGRLYAEGRSRGRWRISRDGELVDDET